MASHTYGTVPNGLGAAQLATQEFQARKVKLVQQVHRVLQVPKASQVPLVRVVPKVIKERKAMPALCQVPKAILAHRVLVYNYRVQKQPWQSYKQQQAMLEMVGLLLTKMGICIFGTLNNLVGMTLAR
jgi:hypothetical protein